VTLSLPSSYRKQQPTPVNAVVQPLSPLAYGALSASSIVEALSAGQNDLLLKRMVILQKKSITSGICYVLYTPSERLKKILKKKPAADKCSPRAIKRCSNLIIS
jgi:hypothetical protein